MIELAQTASTDVIDACSAGGRGFVCDWVYAWTGNQTLADVSEWLLHRPLRILLVLILAWIASRVVKKLIVRFTKKIALTYPGDHLDALRQLGPGRLLLEKAERSRAEARAETLGHVLRGVALAVVWTVTVLIVLGEAGFNLAPLVAGAGIGGIALGFGAQSMVKDFLSGLLMLVEDHCGVGDVIDFGEASGTVEAMSLRSTTIRDVRGTLWHVPNGEIVRVANLSKLWSRAVVDIEVAYDTDLRMALNVLQEVGDEMWEDPEWGNSKVAEQPEVWGVQSLGSSGIALRIAVKTEPSMQWSVERELRLRVKEALDGVGIEIPFPQRTVWIRGEGRKLDNEVLFAERSITVGDSEERT